MENIELKRIHENLKEILKNQKTIIQNISDVKLRLTRLETKSVAPMFEGLNYLIIQEQERNK